jgi:hypothetical protein
VACDAFLFCSIVRPVEESAMDGDLVWKLADLRGQIGELGSAIRQLRRAGMDSAAAQLKGAELEDLMQRGTGGWVEPTPDYY